MENSETVENPPDYTTTDNLKTDENVLIYTKDEFIYAYIELILNEKDLGEDHDVPLCSNAFKLEDIEERRKELMELGEAQDLNNNEIGREIFDNYDKDHKFDRYNINKEGDDLGDPGSPFERGKERNKFDRYKNRNDFFNRDNIMSRNQLDESFDSNSAINGMNKRNSYLLKNQKLNKNTDFKSVGGNTTPINQQSNNNDNVMNNLNIYDNLGNNKNNFIKKNNLNNENAGFTYNNNNANSNTFGNNNIRESNNANNNKKFIWRKNERGGVNTGPTSWRFAKSGNNNDGPITNNNSEVISKMDLKNSNKNYNKNFTNDMKMSASNNSEENYQTNDISRYNNKQNNIKDRNINKREDMYSDFNFNNNSPHAGYNITNNNTNLNDIPNIGTDANTGVNHLIDRNKKKQVYQNVGSKFASTNPNNNKSQNILNKNGYNNLDAYLSPNFNNEGDINNNGNANLPMDDSKYKKYKMFGNNINTINNDSNINEDNKTKNANEYLSTNIMNKNNDPTKLNMHLNKKTIYPNNKYTYNNQMQNQRKFDYNNSSNNINGMYPNTSNNNAHDPNFDKKNNNFYYTNSNMNQKMGTDSSQMQNRSINKERKGEYNNPSNKSLGENNDNRKGTRNSQMIQQNTFDSGKSQTNNFSNNSYFNTNRHLKNSDKKNSKNIGEDDWSNIRKKNLEKSKKATDDLIWNKLNEQFDLNSNKGNSIGLVGGIGINTDLNNNNDFLKKFSNKLLKQNEDTTKITNTIDESKNKKDEPTTTTNNNNTLTNNEKKKKGKKKAKNDKDKSSNETDKINNTEDNNQNMKLKNSLENVNPREPSNNNKINNLHKIFDIKKNSNYLFSDSNVNKLYTDINNINYINNTINFHNINRYNNFNEKKEYILNKLYNNTNKNNLQGDHKDLNKSTNQHRSIWNLSHPYHQSMDTSSTYGNQSGIKKFGDKIPFSEKPQSRIYPNNNNLHRDSTDSINNIHRHLTNTSNTDISTLLNPQNNNSNFNLTKFRASNITDIPQESLLQKIKNKNNEKNFIYPNNNHPNDTSRPPNINFSHGTHPYSFSRNMEINEGYNNASISTPTNVNTQPSSIHNNFPDSQIFDKLKNRENTTFIDETHPDDTTSMSQANKINNMLVLNKMMKMLNIDEKVFNNLSENKKREIITQLMLENFNLINSQREVNNKQVNIQNNSNQVTNPLYITNTNNKASTNEFETKETQSYVASPNNTSSIPTSYGENCNVQKDEIDEKQNNNKSNISKWLNFIGISGNKKSKDASKNVSDVNIAKVDPTIQSASQTDNNNRITSNAEEMGSDSTPFENVNKNKDNNSIPHNKMSNPQINYIRTHYASKDKINDSVLLSNEQAHSEKHSNDNTVTTNDLQTNLNSNNVDVSRYIELINKVNKIKGDVWQYKDPSGNIQGPFSSELMFFWWYSNYFPHDLPVRFSQNMQWFNFNDLFPQGTMPFVLPLIYIKNNLFKNNNNAQHGTYNLNIKKDENTNQNNNIQDYINPDTPLKMNNNEGRENYPNNQYESLLIKQKKEIESLLLQEKDPQLIEEIKKQLQEVNDLIENQKNKNIDNDNDTTFMFEKNNESNSISSHSDNTNDISNIKYKKISKKLENEQASPLKTNNTKLPDQLDVDQKKQNETIQTSPDTTISAPQTSTSTNIEKRSNQTKNKNQKNVINKKNTVTSSANKKIDAIEKATNTTKEKTTKNKIKKNENKSDKDEDTGNKKVDTTKNELEEKIKNDKEKEKSIDPHINTDKNVNIPNNAEGKKKTEKMKWSTTGERKIEKLVDIMKGEEKKINMQIKIENSKKKQENANNNKSNKKLGWDVNQTPNNKKNTDNQEFPNLTPGSGSKQNKTKQTTKNSTPTTKGDNAAKVNNNNNNVSNDNKTNTKKAKNKAEPNDNETKFPPIAPKANKNSNNKKKPNTDHKEITDLKQLTSLCKLPLDESLLNFLKNFKKAEEIYAFLQHSVEDKKKLTLFSNEFIKINNKNNANKISGVNNKKTT
ncbi:conserved Plasmodium protein, unknown function [Plasmodium vinckei vinckei]|uniref:GYF domain-containing protein n=1 Tax=Plasmodium vinckei vinckei TaxID=54757 RepID=A0A081I9C5_PLAVN|nr:conserved Plasmodium protein, unknown function [Plasmodium vinckei vinckei]KEG00283.1 hypothetical protein YYE_04794 [Plasmodium vinckei vinckei]VEV54436.1 conserved Plasmodium protein, unknown function [Plasmodium vinckei vinckei]